MIHPGYMHGYSETELRLVAQKRDRYAYCSQSIVEHLFWCAGKSENDATYKLGNSYMGQDFNTHMSRAWMWA